ncbi:MAG: thiol:disulfide interchange protein DsbA/DsbL [Betaproteobacteria bacterium]|nr:thiol:disulfide interchange protein DsbA/DsbL [Betaproteobacteria bacterium]
MKWFSNACKTLVIGGLLVSTTVFSAVVDRDYVLVVPPRPTDSGKKVEIVEVFSYACPHCNTLAPMIEPWAKKLPSNVVFKRIPVSFGRPQWALLAKTYYALDAINEADRLHEKIFAALHTERINLNSQDVLFDWLEKQGVNRQKFMDAFNSFSVQSRVQRGDQKAMEYGVDAVPTVIIDGKFRTSPSMAGGNGALFPVMNDLIKQTLKARGL